MLRSPLSSPLRSPLSSPLAARRGGGLPAPTRFVSNSAANGYAIGANSGSGDTRDAPWLTIEHAIANSVDGDVIYINDGSYPAATFYNVVDKGLTFVAQNRRAVTISATGSQTRNVNISASANRLVRFYGLVFSGVGSAQAAITIGSAALTSLLTVEAHDCRFENHSHRLILSNAHRRLNLIVRGCEAESSAWAGLNLVQVQSHEEGSFDIRGLAINGDMTSTSTKVVVEIQSVASLSQAYVSGVNGTVTASSTSGGLYGVRIRNVDDARIVGNALTISRTGGANSGAYMIYCDNATLSAHRGIIEDNGGGNLCNGGYLAIIGADGATAGTGRHNDGRIARNDMLANPTAASPIHGYMIGYGSGGEVVDNVSDGAALATIAKEHTGGLFARNTIRRCNSQAIRAKGAVGTIWEDNIVEMDASFVGTPVYIDANTDSPIVDSDVTIRNNTFNVDATPPRVVDVLTGSSAAFSGNTYNISGLGSDPWRYQGVAYQTLADWRAAIEPTALP